MVPREIFRQYIRERRQQDIAGQQRENLRFITRYTPSRPGADGFVGYPEIPSGLENEVIDEQLAYFAAHKLNFEWKVYAFDEPVDLRDRLTRRGFMAEDTEMFAVLPLADESLHLRDRRGIEVRPVVDTFGVSAMVAVQKLIWKKDFSWLGRMLEEVLEKRPNEFFGVLALAQGKPIGCGWMDFPPGSAFADLHGGCVLPEYRGRGVYRALLNARIREAQKRDVPYLAVDAAPMSRPIVEHAGFQFICETWPMKWRQESKEI